jgi:hypothetical protein
MTVTSGVMTRVMTRDDHGISGDDHGQVSPDDDVMTADVIVIAVDEKFQGV